MHRFLKVSVVLIGLVLAMPSFAWVNVTVKKTDTMNSLAQKYRPSGVASMDMVIAIRNANPVLASKGLKSGETLRVPTTQTEVRQAITGTKQKASPATTKSKIVAQPTPAKSTKTNTTTNSATSAQIAGYQTTISNLQQALNNQSQTLQSYQAQIADLNKQLLASQGGSANVAGFLSYADLWFALWLVTFALLLRARRKKGPYVKAPKFEGTEPVLSGASAQELAVEAEGALPEEQQSADLLEPSLHEISAADWRQVELDIPAAGAPTQAHIRLEPSFSFEEQQELVGEQQTIIKEIANDHDNIEWHMALLEFYIKTDNEGGFSRHMQTMARTGLMADGDTLWEKIRKMYLNGWIYKEVA